MRILFTLLLLISPLIARGEEAPPATHRQAAEQLVELLKDTDNCLAGCVDAASVQAALPRLRELAERAHCIKQTQNSLPEPTTQDYMAAQSLVAEFVPRWQSIRAHIARLKSEKLLTPELSSILVIAPEP